MAKRDPNTPTLTLSQEGEDGDILRCMVLLPNAGLKGGIKLLRIRGYLAVTSLELVFNGFDELLVNGDERSLSGSVSLEMVYEDGEAERHELARYAAPLPKKQDGRFTSADLLNAKKRIESSWQQVFKSALANISKLTQIQDQHSPSSIKSSGWRGAFLNQFGPQAGIGLYLKTGILFLIAAFLLLAVISKAMNMFMPQTNTNPLDATALVNDHENTMNKIYDDLGIDRSKLSDDLSCFSE